MLKQHITRSMPDLSLLLLLLSLLQASVFC